MKEFWLCFVPLFVAVNAIGILPLYLTLTDGIARQFLPKIIFQSVLTASIVAVLFLFVGKAIFRLLGITVADFMVAGGILLFVIAMRDLAASRGLQRQIEPDLESVGSIPLGVPLIAGPAVLTTVLILGNQYGHIPTVVATLVNIVLAGFIFRFSHVFVRFMGKAGTRTVSKIANLILASIAVMIVRKGLTAFGQF